MVGFHLTLVADLPKGRGGGMSPSPPQPPKNLILKLGSIVFGWVNSAKISKMQNKIIEQSIE